MMMLVVVVKVVVRMMLVRLHGVLVGLSCRENGVAAAVPVRRSRRNGHRLLILHVRHRWILTVSVTRAARLIHRRIALERRGRGLTAAGHVEPDVRR